jgi:acetyl-CoA synthase
VGYPDTALLPACNQLPKRHKGDQTGPTAPHLKQNARSDQEELTFENARLCGESTAYAAEIIESLRYLNGAKPHVEPWTGYLTDPILRRFGIQLVDWTIPGQAVVMGKAKDSKSAAKILSDLQAKGLHDLYLQ